MRPENCADFYRTAIKSLQPGVTEFVINVAFANEEMTAGYPGTGYEGSGLASARL
jgi:hypothetical protein